MATTLIDVIRSDCVLWESLINEQFLYPRRLELKEFPDSKRTGLYQLRLNGGELCYGTLEEINAVVKSMITRIVNKDFV